MADILEQLSLLSNKSNVKKIYKRLDQIEENFDTKFDNTNNKIFEMNKKISFLELDDESTEMDSKNIRHNYERATENSNKMKSSFSAEEYQCCSCLVSLVDIKTERKGDIELRRKSVLTPQSGENLEIKFYSITFPSF